MFRLDIYLHFCKVHDHKPSIGAIQDNNYPNNLWQTGHHRCYTVGLKPHWWLLKAPIFIWGHIELYTRIIHIPVFWFVRCFITVPVLARWWVQAWTCPQCWASAPGRVTVIAYSNSTWLCLHWGPSFLPVGARQDTWYCSGQWLDGIGCKHHNVNSFCKTAVGNVSSSLL